nr:ATP synthase B subunit precursor [Phymatolithon calcareum]
MINIIFIIFTFLILIYKKIVLLNEETLILVCFIIFVFLSMNSFGTSFKKSLENESDKIKLTLENSLKQVHTLLVHFSDLNTNFKNILDKFYVLGNYYYILVSLITSSLPTYTNRKLSAAYIKRLNFLSKVEKQTVKLLSIVVVKKLSKIVKLKQFYNVSIKNNYFLCLHTVSLREYIQLVSSKK